MEANVFVAKLKADGSKNDLIDLVDARKQYVDILTNLSAKDRAPFALNVLCTLCRNIEKVRSWSSVVDTKLLLTMSLECVRETQKTEYEKVKTLACVYHIHRYAVRQKSAPPKMVLELSYIAFNDNFLKDYCRTYCNILCDRITYIEKIKASRQDITKLYPKLIADITTVIELSGIEFCLTILNFIMKKLHYLYSDLVARELNGAYRRIFEVISLKSDVKNLQKMAYKDVLDIYVKLNDCIYIVAENSSIDKFENTSLNSVVQTCISLIGHAPDLLYCIQSIYLNGFCSILTEKPNLPFIENIFTNLVSTCEMAEKHGYVKAMNATYPYVNQFLKLYIEYNMLKNVGNDQKSFTEPIQMACLTLIEFLLRKLKNCNQILKCENCQIKTGLHDGLRLSLLVKDLIAANLEKKTSNEAILPVHYSITVKQYEILKDLCAMGCANYQKCYKKLQSDVHNIAILLNKSQNHEYSIKLFEIYLKNEIMHLNNEQVLKNVSRALYNKSICELDSKQYEKALLDAYLSLVFAYPEGLSSEKYMSLAMDIKAKELKSRSDDDDDSSSLQMATVVGACAGAVRDRLYGNLKPFFCNLRFSELLQHEYCMYAKLWPSIGPIAAVCEALLSLSKEQPSWIIAKDDEAKSRLYSMVVEAPSVVRTVHNVVYTRVVSALLEDFESDPPATAERRICRAAMMFLKAEFDLAEAGRKYGWKSVTRDSETDETQSSSTLAQEYEAIKYAISGVELWADIVANIDSAKVPDILRHALPIAQVFVRQLSLLGCAAHATQLALSCRRASSLVRDQETYLSTEAVLLRHTARTDQPSTCDLGTATGLMHAAAAAIYYNRIGMKGVAAKVVQAVQAKLLDAYGKSADDNLELAMGYLLDAQWLVYGGAEPCALTAAVAAQRHYLTAGGAARAWSFTRARRLTARAAGVNAAFSAAQLSTSLGMAARARAAASVPAPPAPAAPRARLSAALAEPARTHHAQNTIDNCLKYTLGIPASADRPAQQEPDEIIPQLNPDWPPGPIYGLAVRVAGLEAATYFRAKQFENAKKYYEIAFKSVPQAEIYIKNSLNTNKLDKNVLETTHIELISDLRTAELEVLMEATYFELSQENYKSADEYIVRIHEILEEVDNISCYLKSDVLNLMMSSACLRKGKTRKVDTSSLEAEFESLRLSPAKNYGVPKTPDAKAEKPPTIIKIKAKDEEVPNTKRRVIKLNLDSEEKAGTSKKSTKKTDFKFPVPALAKPVLEVIPPTPKQKPELLSQTSTDSVFDFATPKLSNKSELLAPIATPHDQFFTPMSTLKTYSKKSLRQGLVKNLESEFSTPKSELKKPDCKEQMSKFVDKENITGNASIMSHGMPKPARDKRGLKRATSPGKLEKRETRIPTRAARLRQPVRLSKDDEERK